jgi:hypothetical protein
MNIRGCERKCLIGAKVYTICGKNIPFFILDNQGT